MSSLESVCEKFNITESAVKDMVREMRMKGRLTRAAASNATGRKVSEHKKDQLQSALLRLDDAELRNLHAAGVSEEAKANGRKALHITSIEDLYEAIEKELIQAGDRIEVNSLETPKGRDLYPIWEVKQKSEGQVHHVQIPRGRADTLLLSISHIRPRPPQLGSQNLAIRTNSSNIDINIIPQ